MRTGSPRSSAHSARRCDARGPRVRSILGVGVERWRGRTGAQFVYLNSVSLRSAAIRPYSTK
eukprot:6191250-Pleurochrysis_carterae.AAC.3